MRFTALVGKSPNRQGYWAMVPALPGCYSAGETFEEVQRNAQEAIILCLEGIKADGEPLPEDGDFIVTHAEVDAPSPVP